ncbi:MAG: peptidoglycan DD-metalloendopeptidase family protein [Gammaproteobacteria bacterium]
MFRNEQDNQNTRTQKFQPFLFISCAITIVLMFIIGICIVTKPQHRIIHTFNHLKLQVSRISLQDAQKPPWRTFTVKTGDNLQKIFTRAGIDQDTYYSIIKLKDAKSLLVDLRPKQTFYLLFDKQHNLSKLIFRLDKLKYLELTRNDNKWSTDLITLELKKKLKTVDGFIQQSFDLATKQYNVPKQITANLVNIFDSRIDFAKQIRPHDEFKIIYEQYYADKKSIKPGNIIAAELINRDKTYYAIRYQSAHRSAGYYMPNGKNWHLAFIRAPLHYKRISSPFGAHRMHPILHIVRRHEGVDLTASFGTPIKASGDGRIVYRGRKGGYGKAVIIHHSRKYTTLYAHMSRFASGLHVGSFVREGEIIGYVGMTGLATGPHVHYEFRIYGIPHDPMKVKLPQSSPIPRKERKAYLAYAKEMVQQLDHLKS